MKSLNNKKKSSALDPGERAQLDSLYYYLENLKDGEYDDLHQEFDELVGMDEDADTMKPPVQYNFTKKDPRQRIRKYAYGKCSRTCNIVWN